MVFLLFPTLPLLPYEKWRIDYVGPVHPWSCQGMAYMIIVMDSHTKWEEAKAMKVANNKTTTLFIFESIIAQYEIPRVLIYDKGTHFLNNLIEELTTTYDIEHRKINPITFKPMA